MKKQEIPRLQNVSLCVFKDEAMYLVDNIMKNIEITQKNTNINF
jgi:hypothetical protein